MPKRSRQARKDRFERIGDALNAIYREAAWRHRHEQHDFGLRPEALEDNRLSSRSAGGPVMKTLQYECTVQGIRGLSQLADRLLELQNVEKELRKTPAEN